MFKTTIFALFCLVFSSSALADEDGHHGHRHEGDYYGDGDRGYYERAPQYYAPPPRYNRYDPRSHQGLAGGVIGSVLGYELGAGNPIASGLGAAAGSYLGNGMAR